jgi:hypothetical protein
VDRNEIHLESNPKLYRRGIPGYHYIANFLMNRVPSDIYRIKNPKLVVEKESHGNVKDIVGLVHSGSYMTTGSEVSDNGTIVNKAGE